MNSPTDEPGFGVPEVVAGYDRHAHELAAEYERLAFEQVHGVVADLLPEPGASVLDVGAGTGRDAAWFASKGHRVVAVEPSQEMRKAGQNAHKDGNIQWLSDRLPALEKVVRSKLTFDLIWLSAVWMHVPPRERRRAFRKLVSVMSPGASMMVSLRQGPPDPSRPMHPVRSDEVEKLAGEYGLLRVPVTRRGDARGRPDIDWQVLWLRLPDDGTNALPLLRHVVFNDNKSTTYKLGLLRVLVRIADGASGFARESEDGTRIEIPLGLVALYWIRAYRPLVEKELPQIGGGKGLRFVKAGFRGLASQSPYDFRVGQRFTGQSAQYLIKAISDAAKCVLEMPAHFTTYPGSTNPVFRGNLRGQVRIFDALQIDEAFLWSFGTFSVPVNLWRAMGRYAPWIEPAIISEWIQMIRGYQKANRDSWDSLMADLRWLEPEHDTGLVRDRAQTLRRHGTPLFCVWTGRRLRESFAVDHCFPFAAWPCNDLWNLLPSSKSINSQKSDRLPSPEVLETAKPRICEWWDSAYLGDDALAERFEDESRSALPAVMDAQGSLSLESVFEGMMVQQLVLKRDQQLEEWAPRVAAT